MTAIQSGQVDSNVMKSENISIQATTMNLTKDNYLYWAAKIKMAVVEKWCVNYINEKKVRMIMGGVWISKAVFL